MYIYKKLNIALFTLHFTFLIYNTLYLISMSSNSLDLIYNVNSLLDLFRMEVISFVDMTKEEQNVALENLKDTKFIDQFEEVCQHAMDDDYLRFVVFTQGVDHLIMLRVNRLVVAIAMCTEKESSSGKRSRDFNGKYMEIDVLCSRKLTNTGKQMLIAAENLALRRGMMHTSLTSLYNAIGFYERMNYAPVPPSMACNSRGPDSRMILDIHDEANQLVQLGKVPENEPIRSVSGPVGDLLRRFEVPTEMILHILSEYPVQVDKWSEWLNKIDIRDHFDGSNLIMTKCLIDTNDSGFL